MIWPAYVAASLWAELIEVTGKNIIAPIAIAFIGVFFTPTLLNAWLTRRVGKKVDKVVGQVTNGDVVGDPKLRKDLDWSIANGTEILGELAAFREDLGRFKDEVRGRFGRLEGDASDERDSRRQIEERVSALERPA